MPTSADLTPGQPEPGWYLVPERSGFRLYLLVTPKILHRVRRATREQLTAHTSADVVDNAELLVTELLANVISAVGHHAPAIVQITWSDGQVELMVQDPDIGSHLPAPGLRPEPEAPGLAENGRGLLLVDELGDGRRTTRRTAVGKQVRCRIPAAR